jgi:hypothetical protein
LIKGSWEMDVKKEKKIWEPIPQGKVFQAHKWERIDDCPLHMNLETTTLQIRHDLLTNSGIIRVEKKHIPINNQIFSYKIKKKIIQSSP